MQDKKEMGKTVAAQVYEASRSFQQDQAQKQESYKSTCITWSTIAGSVVSVFVVPTKDQGELKVGVAVNNELKKDPLRYNVFGGARQSERAIDTLLKCGGSPDQLAEMTDFLKSQLRVSKTAKESKVGFEASTDKGVGAKYEKSKKTTTD